MSLCSRMLDKSLLAPFPSNLPPNTILDCILDARCRENSILHVLYCVHWMGRGVSNSDCEAGFRFWWRDTHVAELPGDPPARRSKQQQPQHGPSALPSMDYRPPVALPSACANTLPLSPLAAYKFPYPTTLVPSHTTARLLDVLTPALVAATSAFLASCQIYEGVFLLIFTPILCRAPIARRGAQRVHNLGIRISSSTTSLGGGSAACVCSLTRGILRRPVPPPGRGEGQRRQECVDETIWLHSMASPATWLHALHLDARLDVCSTPTLRAPCHTVVAPPVREERHGASRTRAGVYRVERAERRRERRPRMEWRRERHAREERRRMPCGHEQQRRKRHAHEQQRGERCARGVLEQERCAWSGREASAAHIRTTETRAAPAPEELRRKPRAHEEQMRECRRARGLAQRVVHGGGRARARAARAYEHRVIRRTRAQRRGATNWRCSSRARQAGGSECNNGEGVETLSPSPGT